MTREGAKKWAKEIQAFVVGGKIQEYDFINHKWFDNEKPMFDISSKFRIKPEPQLVPFDVTDAEKLIGKVVKHKDYKIFKVITDLDIDTPYFSSIAVQYEELSKNYTFLDGSPCGKEV